MHTTVRTAIGLGLLAAVATAGLATPAWSDDKHDRDHRRDWERQRAAAYWRFERGRGWRWEHRPGAWSPFFVWWAIDGRPLLRPYPTVRIVRYSTG
jgi:hypothetical protein